MRVAIYARVSRIDLHPENQLAELIQFAKAMNYEYDIYEEKESTRKTRPIKQDVFQKSLERKYDLILVYKLDRWARSLQELINDFRTLQVNKVEFRSLKDNIILDNDPRNMLMIQILGAFAEFEREMIRERTMAGLARARAEGRIGGRPRKGKEIFKDPSVEEVARLRLENRTVREMAAMLHTSKNRVEKILKQIPPLHLDIKDRIKRRTS